MHLTDLAPRAIRIARKQIQRDNRHYAEREFTSIPKEKWPTSNPAPTAVFRSRGYLVQAFNGDPMRLSICRTSVDNEGRFYADLSWDELQWIKNAVGYREFDAVEIYPREIDLVNVANIRHLWIMKEPLSFTWRKKK